MRALEAAAGGMGIQRVGALIGFFLLLPPPIAAQAGSENTGSPVEVGSTVRFQLPDSVVEGSVVRVDGTGWQVRLNGRHRESVVISPDSLTGMEVHAGRETKVLKGAGIGALTGALSGALIGAITWEEPVGVCWFACDRGSQAAMAALGVGVLGMVGGAIIGAVPRDRWEEVTPPASLQVLPRTEGGVALTGSVGF